MKRMGMDESAMALVEADIAAAPERQPLIQGLRGVRKARFARPGSGKSGGGRAVFYVANKAGALLMLAAYAKSAKGDLSPADRRAILRAVAKILENER
jgi:hypothetical protein